MRTTLLAAMLTLSLGASAQVKTPAEVINAMKAVEKPAGGRTDSVDCSRFVVVYDFTVNSQTAEGEKCVTTVPMALQVGSHVSKYQHYDGYRYEQGDTYKKMGYSHNFKYNITMQSVPTVFVDRQKAEMTVFDCVPPYKYVMKDDYKPIKWSVGDDTLTIGGYLCRRAEADYRGRHWTAWFTEAIPSSAGPWKLGGLPGLILRAADSDSIFLFDMNGIENRADAITYQEDIKAVSVGMTQFIKHRNKTLTDKRYAGNPLYYIDAAILENVFVFNTYDGGQNKFAFVNDGVYLPEKVNVYQPLEVK